jgi:translation initiation factor 3 subunit I
MRPLALKGHSRPITRVRLNQEGDILFSCAKDKHVCVWYTENGERIGTYEGHNGMISDIDVSWDTKTLVSASGDQKMMVYISWFLTLIFLFFRFGMLKPAIRRVN